MIRRVLTLGTTVALLLTSCATFPSGTFSSAPVYYPPTTSVKPTTQRRIPVTFSVRVDNTFGADAWVTEGQIAATAQKKLQRSGMFSDVTCVTPQQAGPNHLSFDVTLSGLSPEERFGIGFLGGLTFTIVPIWTTLDMGISMAAHNRGTQSGTWNTQQSATEVIWAPLILAAPFCNHQTARNKMLDNAMEQLLQSMQDNMTTQKTGND